MTTFVTDVADLIGTPYENNARGPDALDCYGLLIELYRRSGIVLPDFRADREDPSLIAGIFDANIVAWRPCELKVGAALMFRIKGLGCHVGYYLGDDKFVHTWHGSGGVTIERLGLWKHKLIGSYEYVGG